MKLVTKQGQEVVVTIDSKTMMAKVNGHKLAHIKDNKVKILNDMILNQPSLNVLKEEMSKFIKKTEETKKRK